MFSKSIRIGKGTLHFFKSENMFFGGSVQVNIGVEFITKHERASLSFIRYHSRARF